MAVQGSKGLLQNVLLLFDCGQPKGPKHDDLIHAVKKISSALAQLEHADTSLQYRWIHSGKDFFGDFRAEARLDLKVEGRTPQ